MATPSLDRQAFYGLVQTEQAESFSQNYPLQQLYLQAAGGRPRLTPSETVLIDVESDAREIGQLHNKPASADLIALSRVGQRIASVKYQQNKARISPIHTATMRELGMGPGSVQSYTAAMARAQAQQHMSVITRRLTGVAQRTTELFCAKMLSSNSATMTIDGQAVTFATGLDAPISAAASLGGSWQNVATDIPAAIAEMSQLHTDRSGMPVSLIIRSSRLTFDLAKNEKVVAFVNNNSSFINPLGDLPMTQMTPDLQNAQILNSMGNYKDNTVLSYYWPKYTLAFISFQEPGEVLDMISAPNMMNNMEGGIGSRVWISEESGDEWTAVGDNSTPINLDQSRITLFDVT